MTPKSTKKIAVIQMNSGPDLQENLATITKQVKRAAQEGCEWVFTPEVCLSRKRSSMDVITPITLGDKTSKALSSLAKDNGLALFIGSICEAIPNEDKMHNTSLVFNSKGLLTSVYRKLHLFEVDTKDSKIKEADWFIPGLSPESVGVDGITVGLSICYDLRFPELFRKYSEEGCTVLTIPASFTTPTGTAHWDVLCRARAIENQSFVVAANQVGVGAGGVDTYGHSLIIDPWGTCLAVGSDKDEDLLIATLEFDNLAKIRDQLPALKHRKL